jgi:hypothetical protein
VKVCRRLSLLKSYSLKVGEHFYSFPLLSTHRIFSWKNIWTLWFVLSHLDDFQLIFLHACGFWTFPYWRAFRHSRFLLDNKVKTGFNSKIIQQSKLWNMGCLTANHSSVVPSRKIKMFKITNNKTVDTFAKQNCWNYKLKD